MLQLNTFQFIAVKKINLLQLKNLIIYCSSLLPGILFPITTFLEFLLKSQKVNHSQ